MLINRFLKYFTLLAILAGCARTDDSILPTTDWLDEYDQMTAGDPTTMQYGRFSDGYGDIATDDAQSRRIAVLLPLTGQNASVGKTIRTSVETAVLQNAPKNLTVTFHDTNRDFAETINTVLSENPSVIVGPVFADRVRTLRDAKSPDLPVISFTSDATALGNGVLTMNLMPTNSVETIIQEMKSDGVQRFIIMAPDTTSGHLMAGTAKNASSIYEIPLIGIFYYNEKDPESIKNISATASMNAARTSAHTRARQVLSDILINERITALEKSSLNTQLEKLAKTDTVGSVPYDAVLFLGNGDDTKSLASFLRYYNVGARDAKFYGTTMWDGSDIASDFTMAGAKFATLPPTSPEFSELYTSVSGSAPSRLASIGYDATNIAIGTIYSGKSTASYLLDPSGYNGTDGLFRMKPTGESERGLRIVQLNNSPTPTDVKASPVNFITPLYNIEQRHITPAAAMDLQTTGIDPDDHINIPERLRFKYRSKTLGANTTVLPTIEKSQIVSITPATDDDITIRAENYTPIRLESVKRSIIEEYEIYEDEE